MFFSELGKKGGAAFLVETKTVSVPVVLNAKGAYNLMNSESFPTLRVGKRLLVSADRFLEWIDNHSDNVRVDI